MAYANCTSADSCSLGPSLADVCTATTAILAFMSTLDQALLFNDDITGLPQRIDPVAETDDNYDFIIIGGGAGGSVVASRLSEIFDWKVLLLEAGQDEPLASEVPGFLTRFLRTAIDWNYTTTGEANACLTTNGSCYWPAGRTLGGSTILAGPAYLRGDPNDYDDWYLEYGLEGWSYDDIFKYFLKSENNLDIDVLDDDYHATGGPLSVSRFPYLDPFAESYLAAAAEQGYEVKDDLNTDDITGFTEMQFMSENGVRRTTAAAFLWPARDRANLHVSLKSYVTKILIKDGAAYGVEFYKDGEYKTVTANKEVILSAGAMRSPHLLLLSGVGPQEDLESLGVDVILDLPGVGANLQNHVSYFVPYTRNAPNTYDNNQVVANQYLRNQTGPLSAIGVSTVVGIVPSGQSSNGRPDLLIYPAGNLPGCATGEVGALSSTGNKTLFMIVTNTRTKSRGKVSLASSDPLAPPKLWANYFDENDDIEVLVDGIELAINLLAADVLGDYGLVISTAVQAACADHEYASRNYWACAVKQNTVPENHQAGSCRMGNYPENLAVVDHELRVHGIEGLRVADASVMPQVPATPPGPATMMIGERAAHFIKTHWA